MILIKMNLNENSKLLVNGMIVDFDRDLITDPKTHSVTKIGKHEALVLNILIESKGTVVSRDVLLDKGWPGKFVSDNSLNAAIMKLRIALSDNVERLAIKSIPGKGYELNPAVVNEVNEVEQLLSIEKSKVHNQVTPESTPIQAQETETTKKAEIADTESSLVSNMGAIPPLSQLKTSIKKIRLLTTLLLVTAFIIFDILLLSEPSIPSSTTDKHKVYWITPFTPAMKSQILNKIKSLKEIKEGDIYVYSYKSSYFLATEEDNILIKGDGNEK